MDLINFSKWSKIIMHVDMNAFFASIEQRDDPLLSGKPVAITNGDKGSCIITCSYEARAFGIKTGMRFSEAKIKCPSLIRKSSDPKKYTKISSNIMNILYDISPDVEIFSIDEAFLDLTSCKKIYTSPANVAYIIKDRISKSVNLQCSIGISGDKSTAKFAAKMQKPDGITIINPNESENILKNYSVNELCGVSNGIQSFLNHHGVFVCGDMKNIPISILGSRFGNIGRKIWLMAQGKDIDNLKLNTNPPKSIGHGKVTTPNLKNEYDIKKILHYMSEKVARRLRDNNFESNIFFIGIKINKGWIHKKLKTEHYINHGRDIFNICLKAFKNILLIHGIYQVQVTAINPRPINLQKDFLFNNINKKKELDYVVDSINKKFGESRLQPARLLNELDTPDVISPSWRPNGFKKSV
tara:strand:- start:897 stop:2132 length:1236 start_codon:yes stop_codon:yes gene_type:complete